MTPDPKPTEALKPLPCPFCGETKVIVRETSTFRWVAAICENCGAQAGETRKQTLGEGTKEEWDKNAEADAIKEWNTRTIDRDAGLAAMRALLSLIYQSFCENDEEMHNMPPGSYSGKLHERSQETIGISAHLQAMQSNQEQRGAAESCTPSSNAGSLVDLSKQASGQGVGAGQEVLPYNQEQEAKRPIQGGGAQGDQESGERWNPEKTNLLSGLRKKEDFARASRRLQQSIEGDLGVFDLSWPETQKAVVCIFSAVASALKGAE